MQLDHTLCADFCSSRIEVIHRRTNLNFDELGVVSRPYPYWSMVYTWFQIVGNVETFDFCASAYLHDQSLTCGTMDGSMIGSAARFGEIFSLQTAFKMLGWCLRRTWMEGRWQMVSGVKSSRSLDGTILICWWLDRSHH